MTQTFSDKKLTVPSGMVRLHQDVKARICQRLAEDWTPGRRLPSIAQLAEQLGVGLQTAHRAVRELADEGLLVSHRRRGTFVAPDLNTAHLRQVLRRTPTGQRLTLSKHVEVVTAARPDGMVRSIAEAATNVLRERGCRITSAPFHERGNDWDRAADTDAVVVVNPFSRPPLRFGPGQVACVIATGSETMVSGGRGYDVVGVASEQGAVLAGVHLRHIGCGAVGFIGVCHPGEKEYRPTSRSRLQGLEAGFGCDVAGEHRLTCRSYSVEEGARAAGQYLALPNKPQGIFAASDELAVGFILGTIAQGLRPACDYQIVGFDGQQLGRELSEGSLTTVQVPTELMGRRGAEMLIERLTDPHQPVRHLSLGCSLYLGATTAPRPSPQDTSKE